jgi:hypothetical protein
VEPTGGEPFFVQLAEIADVEGVDDAALFCGEFQLRAICSTRPTGLGSGQDVDTTHAKRHDEAVRHRVLVEVPP